MPQKKSAIKNTISRWYTPDDKKVHFKRKNKNPKPNRLRKSITSRQILILLSGRFRGKRVVFLKQLKSGLLLVTGPFKINGVPLKRVNQAYVIPTNTKVDLKGINYDKINDTLFERQKTKRVKKSEDSFFSASPAEKTEQQKKAEEENKKLKATLQSEIDKTLIQNIKKVDLLKKYLSSRFTLTNGMKPHELIF